MKRTERVRLDLNNPVFQETLFRLPRQDQARVLDTLGKLARMTWEEIYQDAGLKWEAISSRKGPQGARLYSFRISRSFRGVGYREEAWLRLLSLHPAHDSAYGRP